jgi:hypothetical protein
MFAIIVPTVGYWYINAQSGPTVSVTRFYNLNLQPGQTIIVNITISDVSGLSSCRINLAWDPNVLKVTTGNPKGWTDPITGIKYDVYEGPFMKTFSNSTIFLINGINNEAGNITAIFNAIASAGVTVSGSGVIATINFVCVNPNTTTIRIIGPREGHSSLQSSTGEQIPHRDIDGIVTSGAPPAIWTEFWFQATVGFALIEIAILALISLVIIRWWRTQAETESEELYLS